MDASSKKQPPQGYARLTGKRRKLQLTDLQYSPVHGWNRIATSAVGARVHSNRALYARPEPPVAYCLLQNTETLSDDDMVLLPDNNGWQTPPPELRGQAAAELAKTGVAACRAVLPLQHARRPLPLNCRELLTGETFRKADLVSTLKKPLWSLLPPSMIGRLVPASTADNHFLRSARPMGADQLNLVVDSDRKPDNETTFADSDSAYRFLITAKTCGTIRDSHGKLLAVVDSPYTASLAKTVREATGNPKLFATDDLRHFQEAVSDLPRGYRLLGRQEQVTSHGLWYVQRLDSSFGWVPVPAYEKGWSNLVSGYLVADKVELSESHKDATRRIATAAESLSAALTELLTQ